MDQGLWRPGPGARVTTEPVTAAAEKRSRCGAAAPGRDGDAAAPAGRARLRGRMPRPRWSPCCPVE